MKPARRIKLLPLILLSLLIPACSGKSGIEEDKLVKLYVDLLIAQEVYFDDPDSLKIKKGEIFDKHGITEEDYREQVESIGEDKDDWERFFNKAYVYIDSLKKEAGSN